MIGAPRRALEVGPKGYIHGWIYVGPPVLGATVHHPVHGKGRVRVATREYDKDTGKYKHSLKVKFEKSGKTMHFDVADSKTKHPLAGDGGDRPKPKKPRAAKKKPAAGKPDAPAKPDSPAKPKPDKAKPDKPAAKKPAKPKQSPEEKAAIKQRKKEINAELRRDPPSGDRLIALMTELEELQQGRLPARTPDRPKAPEAPGPGVQGPAVPHSGEKIRSDVADAYRRLAGRPDDFVKISDLKRELPGIPPAELDRELVRLYRQQKVNIVPQSNQRALTDEQRSTGVRVGDRVKHLINIEPAALRELAAKSKKPA